MKASLPSPGAQRLTSLPDSPNVMSLPEPANWDITAKQPDDDAVARSATLDIGVNQALVGGELCFYVTSQELPGMQPRCMYPRWTAVCARGSSGLMGFPRQGAGDS